MPNTYIILDTASAPIDGAEAYVEQATAPSTYKDPEKIAAYVKEKTAERIESAGLDLDLARLTGVGIWDGIGTVIHLCKDEQAERAVLQVVGDLLDDGPSTRIITYNGFSFDLPLLMRRARYLGIRFPKLNLDRYRSPHVDLLAELSDRDPSRRRPLGFYAKRMGWTDLKKTLTGAEESRVHVTGQWDELRDSILHDVEATRRLAVWLGHLEPVELAATV
jgi:hypothetical protein